MKAVLVDDHWHTDRFPLWDFPNGLPVAGNTYVVVEITNLGGIEGFCLLGYPAIYHGRDWGFRESRFRQVGKLVAQTEGAMEA